MTEEAKSDEGVKGAGGEATAPSITPLQEVMKLRDAANGEYLKQLNLTQFRRGELHALEQVEALLALRERQAMRTTTDPEAGKATTSAADVPALTS